MIIIKLNMGRRMKTNSQILLATAISIGMTCGSVSAEDYGVVIGFKAEHTNNVKKSANETSELKQDLELTARYAVDTRLVDAGINYQVIKSYYSKETFENRDSVNGSAFATVTLFPKNFTWQFKHDSRSLSKDISTAETPDNIEDRQTFQTGPSLNFNLSPRMSLSFTGLYSDVRYEDNIANDSERNTGNITLTRQTGVLGQISFDLNYSDADYKNSDFEFENNRASISVARQFKGGNYNISLGHTKIKKPQEDDLSGTYFNAALDFQRNRRKFGIRASSELTDSSMGKGSRLPPTGDFENGDISERRVGILRRSSGQVLFVQELAGNKTTVSLSAIYNNSDYQALEGDEERRGIRASLKHKYSATINGTLSLRYDNYKPFDIEISGENNTATVGYTINKKIRKNVDLRAGLKYQERQNDGLLSKEYDELSGFVGIYFSYGS